MTCYRVGGRPVALDLELYGSALPIPRITRYFEECHCVVGITVGSRYSDPIVAVSVAVDLPPAAADLLDALLPGEHHVDPWAARVWKAIGGHNLHRPRRDDQAGRPR